MYLPHLAESRVDAVIIHEIVAHKGLRALLKDKKTWNKVMDAVWNSMSQRQKAQWVSYNSHLRGSLSAEELRWAAADEFVAHYSETVSFDKAPSAWRRFVTAVKEQLIAWGLDIKLSLQDLSTLLAESLERYESSANADIAENEEEVVTENLRFSKVTDPALLEQLNNGPTFKAYRAMAFIENENGDVEADLGDGKGMRKGFLYSPMATQERDDNGRWKLRQPTRISEWEQSDEHPEKAVWDDGRWVFVLKKPDGSTVKAAYNPYIHTSLIPLNDQFTSAHKRPELVTVEVEVPKAELTSAYRAEKAKDPVGQMTWHSGPVAGQLPAGSKREVVLSRYDRPIRVVPNSEVADKIVEAFKGLETQPFPWNVFTPALRSELAARGVKFSDKPSGTASRKDVEAYHIDNASARFDEELLQQKNGTLEVGHIYRLGYPSSLLRAAGFPGNPIELSSTRLAEKAAEHGFDVYDVAGLVKAINSPLAVFSYGNAAKAENVIVEIQKDGKNFIVGVHFNQDRRGSLVDDIRGLFPKDNAEWLNWVTQGKLKYVDKKKIQDLIDKQRTNLAEVDYLDLNSVANVIKKFKNPKISYKNDGKTFFSRVSSERNQDTDYFSAIEKEDTGELERQVEAAAKAAGYNMRAYHGTDQDFTTFQHRRAVNGRIWGRGFYFAESEQEAKYWGERAARANGVWGGNGKATVLDTFLSVHNPVEVSSEDGSFVTGLPSDVVEQVLPRLDAEYDADIIDAFNTGYLEDFDNSKTDRIGEILQELGYDAVIGSYYGESHIMVFSPNQIKSADPVVYDDEGVVIPLSERFNTDKEDIRFSRAWHGSGQEFSKFDLSFALSGEGASAHGYGVYVSFKEETGRNYADKLSGMNRTERAQRNAELESIRNLMRDVRLREYNRQQDILEQAEETEDTTEKDRLIQEAAKLNEGGPRYKTLLKDYQHKQLILTSRDAAVTYKKLAIDTPMDELSKIADATRMIHWAGSYEKALEKYKGQEVGEPGVGLYDAYHFLKSTSPEDWESSRRLYTVEVPEDNGDNYLRETAPASKYDVSEVWGKLVDLAEEDVALYLNLPDLLDFLAEYEGQPNKNLYYGLTKLLGSKKAASEFLSDLGWIGIKYNGFDDGECAVIFKDSDVKITERLQFSRAYHGTGADFDRFDFSHMGEGEGSQYYGWGAYVTSNRETGKHYAETIGGTDETVERAIGAIDSQIFRDQMALRRAKTDEERKRYEDAIAASEQRKEDLRRSRHLYTVEIPDDNGQNYLHWDEPITREQSNKIMDAVRERVGKDWGEEFEYELKSGLGTGTYGRHVEGGLNYFLGDMTDYSTGKDPGAERNAKLLNSLGIVGIEIPIDRNGGQRYSGSNYVIFNENDLKITEHLRFSRANEDQEIFVSNAENAVKNIKMEKATPEQWLNMLEKNGGLKAGEDKWLGLSDWLKASDKKTLTKQEVLDYINENKIQIEEVHYSEKANSNDDLWFEILEERYPGIVEVIDFYPGDGGTANGFIDTYGVSQAYNDAHPDREPIKLDENGEFSRKDMVRMKNFANEIAEEIDKEFESRKPSQEKPINDTRLSYTTEGLKNKKEIALTVPTIKPWNKSDDIHFGDAGEGRAIAWIRFGDAEFQSPVTEKEIQFFKDSQAKPEEYESMVNASGRKVWFPFGDKMSHDFIVERDGRFTVYFNEVAINTEGTLEEAVNSLNDHVASYAPNQLATRFVLVIDEIQSNRHQQGRERGYVGDFPAYENPIIFPQNLQITEDKYQYHTEFRGRKYSVGKGVVENVEGAKEYLGRIINKDINERNRELGEKKYRAVPDAPFEKNWHELAMKRMLRLAAEEGYDYVAWTTGEQQAERYNIGDKVRSIDYAKWSDEGTKVVEVHFADSAFGPYFIIDREGKVVENLADANGLIGNQLSDIVGKELALQTMSEGDGLIEGDNLRIGAEGMKGFYDEILPRFANKYGKKWGVKAEDITLPHLEDSGLTMHAIPVTDEMRESVLQGQLMFSRIGGEEKDNNSL